MLLITDNIKYITNAITTYKFSATITTPITVNLSRYGKLGKVTFVSQDIDTALLKQQNTCIDMIYR